MGRIGSQHQAVRHRLTQSLPARRPASGISGGQPLGAGFGQARLAGAAGQPGCPQIGMGKVGVGQFGLLQVGIQPDGALGLGTVQLDLAGCAVAGIGSGQVGP